MTSIFNAPGQSLFVAARAPVSERADVAREVLDSNVTIAADTGGSAAALNADLIATLPESRLDTLLPATQDGAPELPVRSILDTFASLGAARWRDTLRGAGQYGGELIRHETLKKQAVGGARGRESEVEIGPMAIAESLAQRAREAGLSHVEALRLEQIIREGKFEGDVALLTELVETANAADALHTFLDLHEMRLKDTHGLNPDYMRPLTLGVGLARSNESREGILSRPSALAAAHALCWMSGEDSLSFHSAFVEAGTNINTHAPQPGADAQTEQALLLKAVAARDAELSHDEKIWWPATEAGREILLFASNIRGEDARRLIEITSALDLDGDGTDEALQQQWQNASGPAVLQMLRAERDPIYAWSLHTEGKWFAEKVPVINIADEQASMLEMVGVEAVKRGDERGGNSGMVLATMANDQAYKRIKVDGDNRAKALDDIEAIVRDGFDVAIALSPTPGERHAMAITDVRGSGASREFQITDPWNGRTAWVASADIMNGNVGGNAAAFTDYWL